MKGGFNSSFIEIRTLEGDKFIRDLKVGDIVLSTLGYSKVKGIFQRTARFDEKCSTSIITTKIEKEF